MELPRGEMDVHEPSSTRSAWGGMPSEETLLMAADSRFSDETEVPYYPAPTAPRVAPAIQLTTAAEMAQGVSLPAVAPDAFHQGMVVRHPRHGLGRIIALSGSGASRKATVAFSFGQMKFVIAQSPLRPIKK